MPAPSATGSPAPPVDGAVAVGASRVREIAGLGRGDRPGAAAPVLIWTARRSDAQVMIEALGEGGMAAEPVETIADVLLSLEEAGCLVVTQEALGEEAVDALGDALSAQPAWSELPILVLADRVADVFGLRTALEPALSDAQVTYLTRPVAPLVLMTAVHAALAARMRQFLLRDQFEQETELRRELNHRVKNILVTVQAMAKMTERSAGSDAERFAAFQSRLAALASVHAMLFDAAEEATRLDAVARAIMRPFGVLDCGEEARVRIVGPGRPLRAEAVKTLALVVQELVTNALKYGALSTAEGRVELRLDRDGDRGRLVWRETGGPPVAPPERRGYGTRYVTTALAGLFGEQPALSYGEAGFALEVAGPIAPLLAE
jgi:two-component sensor histidine kinase